MRASLPLPLLGIDTDNDGALINAHLLHYCQQEHITFTRSRPFHKNDNPLVEEKDGLLVRGYIGFARLDTVAHTNLLNQIYDRMWLLHNFFHAVMRQQGDPDRTAVRHHHRQVPAFDRLCEAAILRVASPSRLPTVYGSLK